MFDPVTFESRQFQFHKNVTGQEFFERACLRSSSGEAYFGTTNGFYKFNPDSIGFHFDAPKIYITDFKIFNESQKASSQDSPLIKSIHETDTIRLSYKQSVISFEFAALSLGKPGNIEYAYLMDGFEQNWNYVGYKRFATYTNLAPGEYVFRVKTTIGSQLSNSTEANVRLIISPPFWKTTLAYIIYTVFGLSSLFLIQLAILYRVKLINELRLEKVKIQNVQETNLMKLRFFTNISHEFRTPLTLIKAPVEKLISKNSELSEKERSYHYQLIMNSTQKLMRMVNQLMDYRKLEAGSLVLEPSMGDLIGFCRKVWENFIYLSEQKKIQYQFHAEIKTLFIAFDADKLDKVLSNLLSNAFKNTPDGKSITFVIKKVETDKLAEKQFKVDLAIIDTGVGISESDLPHIFDRFYMVAHNRNENVQGTGIGLALAKELIELHNGTIAVQSKEGKGSEFVVRLPIDLGDKKTEEPIGEEDAVTVELSSDVPEILIQNESLNGANRVLIVEDDDELAEFLIHELSFYYQVIAAKNGEEGIQKAITLKPDLVISDVMMPVTDGIELCRTLKNDVRTSHIPIILLTARYSQEKEIEGFESGADAYVLKPFNLKLLLSRISNLLIIRRELVERFKTGTSLNFKDQGIETKDQKLIQQIIDLIIENITNEKINAEFIAHKLHLSRSLIYIKIEALAGQTVNEFIRNLRLKKATQLMASGEMTITEIAYAVGFSSQSYFSRSFTKQFGCSPKAYLNTIVKRH